MSNIMITSPKVWKFTIIRMWYQVNRSNIDHDGILYILKDTDLKALVNILIKHYFTMLINFCITDKRGLCCKWRCG